MFDAFARSPFLETLQPPGFQGLNGAVFGFSCICFAGLSSKNHSLAFLNVWCEAALFLTLQTLPGNLIFSYGQPCDDDSQDQMNLEPTLLSRAVGHVSNCFLDSLRERQHVPRWNSLSHCTLIQQHAPLSVFLISVNDPTIYLVVGLNSL